MGISASIACGETCRSTEDESTCEVFSTEAVERNYKSYSLHVTDRADANGLPTLLYPPTNRQQEWQDGRPHARKGTSYFKKDDFSEEPGVANHDLPKVYFHALSQELDLPHDGRVKERQSTGFVTKEEVLELAKQLSDAESDGDKKVKFHPSNDVLDLLHDGRVKTRKGTGYVTKEDLTLATDSVNDSESPRVRFRKAVAFNLPHDRRVKVRKGTGYVQKVDLPEELDVATRRDHKVCFRAPSQVFDLPHDGRVRARRSTGYVKNADVQDLIEMKQDHQVHFQSFGDVFDIPHDGRVRERKGTGFVTKQELAMLLGAVGSAETVGEDEPSGDEASQGCGGEAFSYGRMRTSMLLGKSELVQALRDACGEGGQMQSPSAQHAHNMRTAMLVSKSALINAVLARMKTLE